MKSVSRSVRRAVLPVGVFAAVAVIHYLWLGLFPEQDPVQARWAPVASPAAASWLTRYVETGSYWLGLSYGLSLAFAAAAFRRYREERLCPARNLAIGGVTLSGALAMAGCYLLGCCGSPMLVVYLNLFGAKFVPFAKPLVAGLTAVSLLGAWWWMDRAARGVADGATGLDGPGTPCECGTNCR